jgi:hypothetical protein
MSDAVKDNEFGQWFLVYVRWPSGKRETIRTMLPGLLFASDAMVVMACLPAPRVMIRPFEGWGP